MHFHLVVTAELGQEDVSPERARKGPLGLSGTSAPDRLPSANPKGTLPLKAQPPVPLTGK